MRHQEGHFSTRSGDELFHQHWLPEENPKAAILLVHGFAEHRGRYANLVERVVPVGYAVFGVDHIGHEIQAASAHILRTSRSTRAIWKRTWAE